MTSAFHQQNETLVDRLIAEGSDLSLEAAEKIMSLRRRGKFWERSATLSHRKYMSALTFKSELRNITARKQTA